MTDYLMAHGVTDPAAAHHQAIITLGNAVKRQAFVLGFSDAFGVIAIVLVLAAVAIISTRNLTNTFAGGAH
jgi:MFS transporter, DHA2 family, multidrug resistance protein